MVERYIASDGSIKVRTAPPPNRLQQFLFASKERTAVTIAVIALFLKFDVFNLRQNPLANGRIPASLHRPEEHWSTMADDLIFVRTMTEALEPLGEKQPTTERGLDAIQRSKLHFAFERADFGGPDGRVAEKIDWRDMENIRVTRCSTTKHAITAYMCGAEVATNMDVGKLGSTSRKTPNYGLGSFREYIQCRHQQGSKNNNHRRSVYRIGIGTRDHLSGYSHAFSIVAQPDGTFFWLQSFISHYSLTTWMQQKDSTKKSGLSGHLTFQELMEKFHKMKRIMHIASWTDQANDDYLDLFNVDKRKESLGNTGARTTVYKWNPDHRLDHFVWDEACEYPLPEDEENNVAAHANSNQSLPHDEDIDECAIEHTAWDDLLKKLEESSVEDDNALKDLLKNITKEELKDIKSLAKDMLKSSSAGEKN